MTPKTLVVPLDGSEYAERALPVAEAIAERIGGNLLLVSAQYQGPLEPRAYLEERAALRDRCPVDVVRTKDDVRRGCHRRGRRRHATIASCA